MALTLKDERTRRMQKEWSSRWVVFSQGFIDMGSQKDMKTAGKGGLKRGVVLHEEFHSTCTASVPMVSGLDQLRSCLLVTINVVVFLVFMCVRKTSY